MSHAIDEMYIYIPLLYFLCFCSLKEMDSKTLEDNNYLSANRESMLGKIKNICIHQKNQYVGKKWGYSGEEYMRSFL